MFRKSRRRQVNMKYNSAITLVNVKLRFAPDQLLNLNIFFANDKQQEKECTVAALAKSVAERLTQRLLCGVGQLDARFASKYLISLDRTNEKSNIKREYLVRLDALSQPRLYADGAGVSRVVSEGNPPGYAKFAVYDETAQLWRDLTDSSGYLRRDKVQTRFVQLLAIAAGGDSPVSPLHVDEATLCASPGKVVDAVDLDRILQTPSKGHVFYGPAGNCPRFPEPRDFRLAIVDEPAGVRVSVNFLSPVMSNVTVEVRLLLAIGVDRWPSTSTFPSRIPLGHADCLLYNRAALAGVYLVGHGVQSTSWQMRLPATETALIKNYNETSTVLNILNVLYTILDEIQEQQPTSNILTKYTLKTILFYELEKDFNNPINVLHNWAKRNFARHVLKVLDQAIGALRRRNQESYFFPGTNLLPNPGHLSEDDYEREARQIELFMLKLFDESSRTTREEDDDYNRRVEIENILINKWTQLVTNLVPPQGTRSRRGFCFAKEIVHSQYTQRQLEYIGLLLKNVLMVKEKSTTDVNTAEERCGTTAQDDVVHLLMVVMDQARDYALHGKNVSNFNRAALKLLELVRQDQTLSKLDVSDDVIMVRTILKWLYKGLDHSKRHLGPVLRPFLNVLFATSHETSWHMEYIKQAERRDDELKALGTFATLVNEGCITPSAGLIDCVRKGWIWAEEMLNLVERNGYVRIFFVPERRKVIRHVLSLAAPATKDVVGRSKPPPPDVNFFNGMLLLRAADVDVTSKRDHLTQHNVLRDESPMTKALAYRRGYHRCAGDLVHSLMCMHKLHTLQDVAECMQPGTERERFLDALNRITRDVKKRQKASASNKINAVAKYTPTVETFYHPS